MAELTTLARPYAKAAFEFALAANDLEGWAKMLSGVAAIAQEKKVSDLLSSPALTNAKQADMLISLCGDELSETGSNFLKILSENKRLQLLSQISDLFAAMKAAQEQRVDVEVQTAFEIDTQTLDNLISALGKSLNRRVQLQTVVDKSLIGGVVIRAGDTVIDSSIRGKLAKLAEKLAS